jgi:hypothetical protein
VKVNVAFAALCDLGIALGIAPLNEHAGCWHHRIDERWAVWMNGHKVPMPSVLEQWLDPFHCYVEYNGWPAGIFSPFGGVIAAGEGANENAFIAAIERATAAAKATAP